MSAWSISMSPSTRQPGMVSFMRLMQRRKVDLPQPDGPMKAITDFFGSSPTAAGARSASAMLASVMGSPATFEALAQVDRKPVHHEQEQEQDDDRGGGLRLEAGLRQVRPEE